VPIFALRAVRLRATAALLVLGGSPLLAQVTPQDYARAEGALGVRADSLVLRDRIRPNWIGKSDRFWYRVRTPRGTEFVYVDPSRKLRRPAFDHAALAAALGRAADTSFAPDSLPFETLEWEEQGKTTSVVVSARKKTWRCDLARMACDAFVAPKRAGPGEAASPDGRLVAFTKNRNLWVRQLESGQETQLTTDGALRYDYGSAPESNLSTVTAQRSGLPQAPGVLWSADSKRLLTYRLDQRGLPEFGLVQSVVKEGWRPKIWSFVVPIPGDTAVARIEWVLFDATTGNRTTVDAPRIPVLYQSPLTFREAWWDSTGSAVYYLERERGVRAMWLKAIDVATGRTRTLLEERGPTLVEASLLLGLPPNVRVIAGGTQAIWFSQRDGWAHLYRFDLASGRVLNRVTQGDWVVREIVQVDEKAGKLWFTAGGREPGRDPYYRHLYSVNLDGSALTLLSPEDAEHDVTPSPTGGWLLDRFSRVDLAPATVLRSADGKTVIPLESADISRLLATGWRYPERFSVKAADGTTDLYGIILRPSRFDSTRKSPVIEEIYPGPQTHKVPKAFIAGGDHHALVELGFVGVQVDGRGTPLRSKAFHSYSYRHLENGGGLEDHVAAYRQLGTRYPFLDLDRIGIYGHSGGGFASTRAMFLYPDVYKVAVSSAGNHDQRGYIALWGETYHGLPVDTTWAAQANASIAHRLQGKLMLAFGDMDDNVPPALTIQVIDALTRANKDYDLLIVPNGNHGMAASPYFIRRRWDYFVRHLLGANPPLYEVKTGTRFEP